MYDLATKQARGESEQVPFETVKLGGKLATYENMRANADRRSVSPLWKRRPRSRYRPYS